MRKFLGKVYRSVRALYRINLHGTIYVNFALLPFKEAIHFPIICYGKLRFHNMSGRVVITSPIKVGMIKIGFRWIDAWPISYLPTQLNITGKLLLKNNLIIGGGVFLNAQRDESIIIIDENVIIGSGCMVKSMHSIHIGAYTRIAGGCTVMDSNMHYVKNIATGVIPRNTGSISIGSRCWINYGSVITKGASIPDYSIVARNSFLSKDYSVFGSNLFLVGCPAKVVNKEVQRIFNYDREKEITYFFKMNPEADFFQDSVGIKNEEESFDTPLDRKKS